MDANSRTTKRIGGKTMEKKIDEIFTINEVKYQCVKSQDCKGCCFYSNKLCAEHICCGTSREDGEDVIFKEIKEL